MDKNALYDAYMDLEERVKAVPIEATIETLNLCESLLDETNQMIQQASNTDNVVYDAYIVSKLALTICSSTKILNVSESNLHPELFAKRIVHLITGTSSKENWSALATKLPCILNYAPGFTYIDAFGDQSPITKKVVEHKKKQARKPLEKLKEVEKVQKISRSGGEADALNKLGELLKRCHRRNGFKPICFFRFCVDPNSYSKTIENIFNLSFLARDNHVEINLDAQNLPVLTPTYKGDSKENILRDKARTQTIMTITYSQWKEIVREFNITKAIIP